MMKMQWPYKPDEPEPAEHKEKVEGGITPEQLKELCQAAIKKVRPVHRHTPLDGGKPSDGEITMISGARRTDN